MNGLYYSDDTVALYHGDARHLLPYMADADLILADPPYGSTGHTWDRWPDGWPEQAAVVAKAMWCFGSMRVFLALTAALAAAATAFGAWAWTTTRRPPLPARPPLDDQLADYITDIAREVFQP